MYFNKTYKRSGTLWEGRYRSCLVQNDKYLLALYRYIELNLARAVMVQEPSEYSWSSYQCNGLGKHSDLLTPYSTYLNTNEDVNIRQKSYRALFYHHVESKLIEEIGLATHKGLALGNTQFKLEV
ncbi:MAG: transposase [Alteromonadales bacterium]|nr:transposase [Alteromonadales bacterium]